jgi:hypothetical protein
MTDWVPWLANCPVAQVRGRPASNKMRRNEETYGISGYLMVPMPVIEATEQ